jgi:hypothetical protein
MFAKGLYERKTYTQMGIKKVWYHKFTHHMLESLKIRSIFTKFIYTTISLNNTVTIGIRNFTITDITLNLLTGKTNLKLNNVVCYKNHAKKLKIRLYKVCSRW